MALPISSKVSKNTSMLILIETIRCVRIVKRLSKMFKYSHMTLDVGIRASSIVILTIPTCGASICLSLDLRHGEGQDTCIFLNRELCC